MPVVVSTPCRLHFGLLRFEQAEGPSFGGMGMMIDQPRVELELEPARQWHATGPAASRARAYAERALDASAAPDKPRALRLRVHTGIPLHRGLGGGTQLALAVAAGIRALLGQPPAGEAAGLASAVGRGQRSAVGSHGFIHGGLLWEKGRPPGQSLAPLAARVALPSGWRIVLTAARAGSGRSGRIERQAFDSLPPVAEKTTRRLEELAERQILPAARQASLDDFGESVYEYGRVSGECFAAVQGGPYASAEIEACVASIRAAGVRGAGQSSWGPTVFAIVDGQELAESLARTLATQAPWPETEIEIATPDNRGAIIDPGDCRSDHSREAAASRSRGRMPTGRRGTEE